MKGLFLTLALLSFGSLFAQEVSTLEFPSGVEFQKATPQQLADAVSKAVKDNPQQATMVVREAMGSLNSTEGKFSEIEKKRAAAIVSAAVAAAPGINANAIIAAGAGTAPTLGSVVLQAANAITTAKTSPAEGNSPTGMLLGNIRVQEVLGKGVKLVDANGKTSNLKEGDFLRQGVRIVTGPEGSAVLIFENGSLVRVNANSEFSIEKFQQDPFEAEGLDYSTMKGEPSRSVTRTGVIKGEISFDVAALHKNSAYEIVTPVGIAGIRGTGGFVKSTPNNQSQAASFGLFEGTAIFTSASGQAQMVSQNQAIGISGPKGNFAINLNPNGGESSLSQSRQQMSQSRPKVPTNPFIGAPPRQAAPAGPISSLTAAQQQSLLRAAVGGAEAVAEAALQLSIQSPNSAPEIAAAATDLYPVAAFTLAITFPTTFINQGSIFASFISYSVPTFAPAIAILTSLVARDLAADTASATASIVPYQGATIATWVGIMLPSIAPAVASSVAVSIPSQAVSIATSVASAVPSQASAIASYVVSAFPLQAATIASAIAGAVPSTKNQIFSAATAAAPTQSSAIAVAAAADLYNQNSYNSINDATLSNRSTAKGANNPTTLTRPTPPFPPETRPTPTGLPKGRPTPTVPPETRPTPTGLPKGRPTPTVPPVSPSA